ncbi:hypothetical protein [Breznakiella homolactica]|uniref:Lipoprotein n=1 Tax=Breznakiella homolactica TaxID=2798577 RepID=A0A7T7XMC4_9SPIR|nr:hypothetical protein [Breznakiella homolactica]QQO08893.1 hypothetical protein JFL75_18480 [Breznakiella homolactica]
MAKTLAAIAVMALLLSCDQPAGSGEKEPASAGEGKSFSIINEPVVGPDGSLLSYLNETVTASVGGTVIAAGTISGGYFSISIPELDVFMLGTPPFPPSVAIDPGNALTGELSLYFSYDLGVYNMHKGIYSQSYGGLTGETVYVFSDTDCTMTGNYSGSGSTGTVSYTVNARLLSQWNSITIERVPQGTAGAQGTVTAKRDGSYKWHLNLQD